MPTYEYECDGCGHGFEEFQLITEAPLKKCPSCGKRKLRRIIGPGAALIFKGSGFYQTDYRSDAYKKAAKADRDSGKPVESKPSDSAKSDKGAAKSTGSSSKKND